MSIEVRVPQLPESVADATLGAWRKQAGEAVRRDENLVELETDKVVLEVPAPANGVLKEVKIANGATVKSGDLLAILEAAAAPAPAAVTGAAPATAIDATTGAKSDAAKPVLASTPPAKSPNKAAAPGGQKLSPSARRMVEENQLDAAQIKPSGKDGRVTKGDVLVHLDKQPAAARPAPPAGERVQRRVPMTRLRARIAQRLVQAQSAQALLTSFNEIDLQAVQGLRSRYKDRFEKEHGVKLGFTSFFVKACIEALKKFPVINAAVDGGDIVYHDYYDIGVAVSTERGLMVPILRDADRMSYADIETAVNRYAQSARDGTLAIEDLTGGTFTLTNGGVFGSLMSTPIVNPPQSAILGMHKIQERPVAVEGAVVVRPMMYVAITYDHRLIDGREAVQFLVTVKDCLEDPARLMLQI